MGGSTTPGSSVWQTVVYTEVSSCYSTYFAGVRRGAAGICSRDRRCSGRRNILIIWALLYQFHHVVLLWFACYCQRQKANTTQLGRSLAMCQNLTPVKFKSRVNNPQLTVLKHNSCFALFSQLRKCENYCVCSTYFQRTVTSSMLKVSPLLKPLGLLRKVIIQDGVRCSKQCSVIAQCGELGNFSATPSFSFLLILYCIPTNNTKDDTMRTDTDHRESYTIELHIISYYLVRSILHSRRSKTSTRSITSPIFVKR